jgi:hypothetical protein
MTTTITVRKVEIGHTIAKQFRRSKTIVDIIKMDETESHVYNFEYIIDALETSAKRTIPITRKDPYSGPQPEMECYTREISVVRIDDKRIVDITWNRLIQTVGDTCKHGLCELLPGTQLDDPESTHHSVVNCATHSVSTIDDLYNKLDKIIAKTDDMLNKIKICNIGC